MLLFRHSRNKKHSIMQPFQGMAQYSIRKYLQDGDSAASHQGFAAVKGE